METLKNTINLMEICFPVYSLKGGHTPIREKGLSFTYTEKLDKEDNLVPNPKVIDDLSIEGDTLSKRRLKLYSKGVKLAPLYKAIFFLGDLIKLAATTKYFVDSSGKIFTYTKNTRAKLKYKRITKVIPITAGGAIIELEGSPIRYKALFAPTRQQKYAGVLEWGMGNILYGFYEEQYPDSWRMV